MIKIDWNVRNTKVLCKLFAEHVVRGNRPNTCLNQVDKEGFPHHQQGM
jgi:hypothetical protein